MEFIYVFILMFISTFGLAMLLRLLADALIKGACRRFDVYVREDENIEEFIRYARKAPFIGSIEVIEKQSGSRAAELAEKYDNVFVAEKRGR